MITVPNTKPRRPGVEAARRLIKKPVEEWEKIEQRYEEMLIAKGGEELLSLQRVVDTLTKRLSNPDLNINDDNLITKEEFISVMKWKFSIGKDRTNLLMKGLMGNSEDLIQKAIRRLLTTLEHDPKDLKAALKEITVLNKVGPAAGSIFLSMKVPNLCCFLADEVVESVNPSGKLEYTPKVFFIVSEVCTSLARTLGEEWTATRVGRVLWTASQIDNFHKLSQINKSNLSIDPPKKKSKRIDPPMVATGRKRKKV